MIRKDPDACSRHAPCHGVPHDRSSKDRRRRHLSRHAPLRAAAAPPPSIAEHEPGVPLRARGRGEPVQHPGPRLLRPLQPRPSRLSDPDARLPAFHQFLDALVARAVNASLGRWEAFWAPDTYSAVALSSPSDVVDKAAYVLANPVAAGLVGSGSAWPGLWSAPERIGGDAYVVKRPKHFFDPKGVLPDEVTLHLTTPPGFDSAEQFRGELQRALEVLEAEARSRHRGRRGFLGVARVLAQKPTARPAPRRTSALPEPARRRAGQVEAHRGARAAGRVRPLLPARVEGTARRRLDVVFPHGTYLLRVLHGVPCAGGWVGQARAPSSATSPCKKTAIDAPRPRRGMRAPSLIQRAAP